MKNIPWVLDESHPKNIRERKLYSFKQRSLSPRNYIDEEDNEEEESEKQ